jgi:glycosyltransferase involved in cell wall biosynthesis
MVKLIIQIPCLNEEKTLPLTLRDIPDRIDGVDVIETLVIDDGSTDRTAALSGELGVNHIIRFKQTEGLSRAFSCGLEYCLNAGADIIVNTDADNQYKGEDIQKLVKPILAGEADMVIGNRNVDSIEHFSWIKKKLQKTGSWLVSKLSETKVPDATSGFRAYSREAAMQLNVLSSYTYTLETVIQAGQKQLVVKTIDIGTNKKLRESRLIKGIPDYLARSAVTMVRIFTLYQPFKVFTVLGGIVFFFGIILGLRYIYLQYFGTEEAEHLASLILSAVFLIMGFNFFILGLLADLIGSNRHLIEDILLRLKKFEMGRKQKNDSDRHET